jgi:hypothetical protein
MTDEQRERLRGAWRPRLCTAFPPQPKAGAKPRRRPALEQANAGRHPRQIHKALLEMELGEACVQRIIPAARGVGVGKFWQQEVWQPKGGSRRATGGVARRAAKSILSVGRFCRSPTSRTFTDKHPAHPNSRQDQPAASAMASKRPASVDGVAPRAPRGRLARLATGKGDGRVAAPPPPIMNNSSPSAVRRACPPVRRAGPPGRAPRDRGAESGLSGYFQVCLSGGWARFRCLCVQAARQAKKWHAASATAPPGATPRLLRSTPSIGPVSSSFRLFFACH